MQTLIHDLDRYFTRTADTIEVPLTELVAGPPHAVESANKFMFAAYNGEKAKRAPISLVRRDAGGYKVTDGKSTLANAIKYGWPSILAVVEKPFTVDEVNLFEEDASTCIGRFETRWEAEAFVDENEDHYCDGGYALFIGEKSREN